jgi:hypothetical protein
VSLKQMLRVQGHLPDLDSGRHEGVRFARARTLAALKELKQVAEEMQRRLGEILHGYGNSCAPSGSKLDGKLAQCSLQS